MYTEKGMIISSIAERLAFTKFYEYRKDFEILEMSKITGNDCWDIKIFSGGTRYLIEIKLRKTPKKDYQTWVIQESKYTPLLKKASEIGFTPMYLNFHNDGGQLFNLVILPCPQWIDRLYPKESQTGNGEMILKKSADLLSPDATQYDETYDISGFYAKAEEMYNRNSKK